MSSPSTAWSVASGPCVKTADNCITSANFPLPYGNDESCEIAVTQPLLGSVSAVGFHMEDYSDVLTINGVSYQGTSGPQGVKPTGSITWTTDASTKGSGWKLCPDTFLSQCNVASHFRVDLGELVMLGPRVPPPGLVASGAGDRRLGDQDVREMRATFNDDRTCVAGFTCALDGLLGRYLSAQDSVIVLETCGVGRTIPRLPFGGRFTNVELSDNQLVSSLALNFVGNASDVAVTAAGGQYRLCWCAGGQDCSRPDTHIVDFGRLHIIGPALDHQNTCVAGQECRVDGIRGSHWETQSAILVLDTCGANSPTENLLPRMPFAGLVSSQACAGSPDETCGAVTWSGPSLSVISAQGGQYRLCWCSLREGCKRVDEFRVDMGALEVVGPSPLHQDRTCVAGQTCLIEALLGHALSANDQIVALDTCASGAGELSGNAAGRALAGVAAPRTPFTGFMLQQAGRSGMSVWYGTTAVTAKGGQYRLCWCASTYRCDLEGGFHVDMGRMTLVGPSRLDQHRTCVSGQTCHFDGIRGHHLETTDTYRLMDTCATDAIVHEKPGEALGIRNFIAGGHTATVDSGSQPTRHWTATATVSWGAHAATFPGGQYRLCWCSGQFACHENPDFRVDVGEVALLGPAPMEQDRTCVSGQTCAFDGLLGYHLEDGDRVMILDTCGARAGAARLVAGGSVFAVTQSGAKMTWGDLEITASGGLYNLCWCANGPGFFDCQTSEGYKTRVGRLSLIGPVSPTWFEFYRGRDDASDQGIPTFSQDRTCVSGQECVIDGILGHQLQSSDRFLVLETCGSVSSQTVRWTEDGIAPQIRASGAVVTFGATHVTAPGGQYRLCWCAAGYRCQQPTEFRVDVGGLTLFGPTLLEQDRTCVAGQTCVLDGLRAMGGTGGDSLFILDTCGVNPAGSPWQLLPEFPNSGKRLGASAIGGAVRTIAFDYGDVALTAPGGLYRMCWCASGYSCSVPEDYRVDFGEFTLIGPSLFEEDRTRSTRGNCGSTAVHVSGDWTAATKAVDREDYEMYLDLDEQTLSSCRQLCDAKDEVELALLLGMELGTSGMSNCQAAIDMNAAFLRCVAVEFADKGDKLGRCRLYSRCTVTSDESSDYMVYLREQPAALNQDRTCVSGQTCVIDAVFGHHLTEHDAFVVLDTCATAAALPRFPNGGRATEVQVQDASNVPLTSQHTDFVGRYDVARMAFGGVVWRDNDELYFNRSAQAEVTAQGGQYRLCWCAASYGCSLDENFRVDVGKVTIVGPRPLGQLRTCISGQHCYFGGLTGHAIQDGDKLLVLDTCGVMESTIPRITHPTDTLANVVVLTSSGSYAAWEPRMITSAGGHYQLCWCAHGQLCSQTEHFRTDLGIVTVIGPAPLQQMRTCISGQTCAFGDITGVHLANDDRILVLDTCIGAGAEALYSI